MVHLTGRREVLSHCLVVPLVSFASGGAAAAESDTVASGKISVRATPPSTGAVYVTARLAGVKKGLSTNRDLSPVASIKIPVDPSTTLPLNFQMTENDLTPEGMDSGGTWWKSKDLVLSARWDEDGDASTRGPNDLVGRCTYKPGGGGAVLELQGRGIAGQFATRKLK